MSKLRIRLKYNSNEELMFCDLKQIKTILDLSARIKERFSVEEIFFSLDGYDDGPHDHCDHANRPNVVFLIL